MGDQCQRSEASKGKFTVGQVKESEFYFDCNGMSLE